VWLSSLISVSVIKAGATVQMRKKKNALHKMIHCTPIKNFISPQNGLPAKTSLQGRFRKAK
jgi:hypothetical protein